MLKYQHYLESVCEYAPELFGDISSIKSRYDTLSQTNDELKKRLEQNKKQIEELQEQYKQTKMIQRNDLVLNIELAELKKKYERAQIETENAEILLMNQEKHAIETVGRNISYFSFLSFFLFFFLSLSPFLKKSKHNLIFLEGKSTMGN